MKPVLTKSRTDWIFEHRLTVSLPTIEGFAAFLGVGKTVLYTWKEKHPEFLNALELIKAEQKTRLLRLWNRQMS